jgi:hypothetical protein
MTDRRRRAILLLPDGVGARNFLLGSFVGLAVTRWNLSILHAIPQDRLATYSATLDAAGLNGGVQWQTLRRDREDPATYFLRVATSYAHMYWADTFSMRRKRSMPPQGSPRARRLQRLGRLTGRLAASLSGVDALDRWHQKAAGRLPAVADYRDLFSRIRPAVLLCSHQRPAPVLAPVLAARALGIPTATCIFSWDNLTSKGRIAAPFDYYLVWSEHMAGELMRYHPGIAPDRVYVVGTPQFDPYADRSLLWPKAAFYAHIGAEPSRPLICYSGGDPGTSPEDPDHVAGLMDMIRAGAVRQWPQVLLRPAPSDPGVRFAGVRGSYRELLFVPPAWVHSRPGDWSGVLPLPEDVTFLANLTAHADLNINVASTMTLDFAIHDKPVVNVAFDVASPPPHGRPLWEVFYQYEHYRPVVELGAARIARSQEDLAAHVNAYLESPALDQEARQKLVKLELGVPPGEGARAILAALDRIAS